MTTITEDYVSFETARLLKENGFDGECDLFGRTDESEVTIQEACKIAYNQGIDDECVIIPTLQMAMKWLSEVHNLYIDSYVVKNYNKKKLEYTYSIQDLDFQGSDDEIDCCKSWNTSQEAIEAAIKYCLENLI